MKFLAILGAVAMAFASPAYTQAPQPATPPTIFPQGTNPNGLPPPRLRGNNAAIVVFLHQEGINTACGFVPPPGRMVACVQRGPNNVPIIYMPNPCGFHESDYYAKVTCHELGHVNGWPAWHPDN